MIFISSPVGLVLTKHGLCPVCAPMSGSAGEGTSGVVDGVVAQHREEDVARSSEGHEGMLVSLAVGSLAVVIRARDRSRSAEKADR